MELRVLHYFLAVAREQSITAAAQVLHLSQPTLSTQLKNLEAEYGKKLLIRGTKGSRKVLLTEEGMILRKRAEEILALVEKTEREITTSDDVITGTVHIGTGESDIIRLFAKTARKLQQKYPDIHYNIMSGNSSFVLDQLDKGLIDFGLIYDSVDTTQYGCIEIPQSDTWGVLMRKDSPLSEKDFIEPDDLKEKPLIVSAEKNSEWPLSKWFGEDISKLNIVANYNLVLNAAILADEGFGYVITYDKLVNTTGECSLCFRPLKPALEAKAYIIWKRYQIFSKAAQKFIDTMEEYCLSPKEKEE